MHALQSRILPLIAYSINSKLTAAPTDKAGKQRAARNAATGWQIVQASLEQLAAELDRGAAIGAIYRDGHRSDPDTIGVQYIAVDLDKDGDLDELHQFLSAHPLFSRRAWMIGATSSSTPAAPRARVFFPLAAPIIGDELKQYAELARRVLWQFVAAGYEPDESSASASRFYFGYQPGTGLFKPDELLTIQEVQALPAAPIDSADLIGDQRQPPSLPSAARSLVANPLGSSPGALRARGWHDKNMQFISRAQLGDQNNVLFWSTVRSAELVAAGYFDLAELRRDAYSAAERAGYVQRDGDRATLATIESAIRAGLTNPRYVMQRAASVAYVTSQRQPVAEPPLLTDEQLAAAAPVAAEPPSRSLDYEPVAEPPLKWDVLFNRPFMEPRDFAGNDDLLIKSDMGTGKTTAASRAIRGKRRVLVLTYRIALAEQLAAGFQTECYKGLVAADIRRIDRLTLSVQSLHKLLGADNAIPAFDVVIIDEVEKVLAALGGNTLRGDAAHFAYELLKAIVQRAGRVIAMDAHASPVAQKFLIEQRSAYRVKTIINCYQRPRGALVMHDEIDQLTATIEQLADEDSGAPVVVVTNSEKEAKRLETMFGDRYGDHEVFAVYGENSGDPERQAVIRDINKRIGNYRLFITSPSLDSGIDIQADVRAVVGIFYREPLTAPECHQMLNRCRRAREYHVYVQRCDGDRETNAERLYQLGLQNAIQTGRAALFASNGVLAVDEFQKPLHGLLSRIDAQANASKNRLYDHFLTLATGYSSITATYADDPTFAARRAAAAELVAERRKQATLEAEPVDPSSFEQLQADGKVTPAIRAGFLRWLIERAAGRVITPDLYDQLHKADQRAGLTALRDFVHCTCEEMQARDRDNASARIRDRRHYTRRRALLIDLVKRLYGRTELVAATLQAEQVQQAVADFVSVADDELFKLFGRRADKSSDPVALVRWLFGKLGLKLVSRQIMIDGQRRRVYQLDQEQLQAALDLAATSYARYQADQAQRAARWSITQNRDFSIFTPPGFEQRRISDGDNRRPPAPHRSPAADQRQPVADLPYLAAIITPLR